MQRAALFMKNLLFCQSVLGMEIASVRRENHKGIAHEPLSFQFLKYVATCRIDCSGLDPDYDCLIVCSVVEMQP
jgi:hypothetical protein